MLIKKNDIPYSKINVINQQKAISVKAPLQQTISVYPLYIPPHEQTDQLWQYTHPRETRGWVIPLPTREPFHMSVMASDDTTNKVSAHVGFFFFVFVFCCFFLDLYNRSVTNLSRWSVSRRRRLHN